MNLNEGCFRVPGKRGIPAGGAGEHQRILLDGEDHDKSRKRVSFSGMRIS